jgi:hypothetical protein
MQKAAHLHGITRDAYPDWCNYCRGRFAAVVDAAVNETAEIVREATAEGATPARAKDRGMGFWEVKRADLLESFAREYKQSRG